ncbi:MAG TPA: FtsX-like permease family protein [Bacteroidetes bacterium]|nr:FtsX-like permease family protein [Bacteroidota bacterium]
MIKRLSERFFKWYCHPACYEDIEGDLSELFHRQLKTSGLRKAEWAFAKEVLLLFRPSILRPFPWGRYHNSPDMIQNYFKIGFRNLRKHPSFTLIHVLGLALGLTAFLFLSHYAAYEKSYDNFHPAADQLYRLTTDDILNGKIQVRDAMSFAPSGKALTEELPEVISYTTTYKTMRMVFRKEGQAVEETGVLAVDSNFLQLFGYEVLKGDKATMLSEPHSIVLTESQARKYFGNKDPLGQSIEVLAGFNRPFKVTGLLRDIPQNTHYRFDMLVSFKSFQERFDREAWNGYNCYTYLLLDKNADIEKVRAKLPALARKYFTENKRIAFNLQPVRDIHLHSDFTYEPEIHGSAKAVRFLGIISIFILLIAWVNYINLSTAKAVERAKEVGLRKVVGAEKRQLVWQFFLESLLVNLLGAVVALSLAQLLAPYFNGLVGKTILTDVWSNPSFLKNLGIFFLLGTLVTGFYPAFVLASFKPIGVLKGSFGRTKKGAFLRQALVVVQFAASLILIASTVIIYQQIRYMTGRDLGINTERVIGLTNAERRGNEEQYDSKYKAFAEELSKMKGVKNVAGVGNLPGGGSSDIDAMSNGVTIIGKTDLIESTIYYNQMDDKFQQAIGLELLAGRNFDHELASDSFAVMVNSAFLKLANISDPESVVGEYLQYGHRPTNRKLPIVGVVKDFNRSSLKNKVEPTIFHYREFPRQTVIKLSGDDPRSTISNIQNAWSKFFPETPFAFAFLDQRFEKLYREDKKFGLIFFNFALLAIFVASMGLFGLSSYLAVQRTKEVGIRKVLGASTSHIVLLFFKDFLWLILIAVAIGIPLVFTGMNDWLTGYAYRIDFPWWVLSLAVLSIVVLAFFTVSAQTLKLAMLNPVKTMRHE